LHFETIRIGVEGSTIIEVFDFKIGCDFITLPNLRKTTKVHLKLDGLKLLIDRNVNNYFVGMYSS
jgi:hypothetical protein